MSNERKKVSAFYNLPLTILYYICMAHKYPFENEIRNLGLKVTGPRLKILSIFEESRSRHLSAEDVYQALKTKSSEVGMATVYRALSNFEKVGILVKSTFDDGKAVFEINQGRHHDHLICMECAKSKSL